MFYKTADDDYKILGSLPTATDAEVKKAYRDMAKKYKVIVVTSDATEQIIIQSKGCILISSREFELEVQRVEKDISERLSNISNNEKRYISDYIKDI